MGLFACIKEAGEKLLGTGEAKAAQEAAAKAPTPVNIESANATAAKAIQNYIAKNNLPTDGYAVKFDAASATVIVQGNIDTQANKEKVLLCCGNVAGVEAVQDQLYVPSPEPEARFYTVVKGDTLSKIAKEMYGNANAYMTIFEANKPMLNHPDKIYPGQALRIPPK